VSSTWELDDPYVEINAILEHWAEQNSLRWLKEYKDCSVRTFFFPLAGDESVQVWVDPPRDRSAVINVAFNSSLDVRRTTTKCAYQFEVLESGLDDALRIAREWKSANAPDQ
jgi:hypothetical protein